MDAAQFFLLRYEPLHGLMTERLFPDLSDAQLRARPHGQNSVAWLVWHVARAEDIGVNRFARDEQQVFDEGQWGKRIGTNRQDLGTGMTTDEVSAFSAVADVAAIRAYWDAVGQQTRATIRDGGAGRWDDVVPEARIRRTVIEEGDYGPNVSVDRMMHLYAGMTSGWAFAHFALTHSHGHFYEAGVVRGMLGFPGP